MTLGDRIAVLRDGRLLQVAPPMQVYESPASVFVAGFVGSPAMSFVPCSLASDGTLEGAGLRLSLGDRPPARARAVLGVRPHDVAFVEVAGADAAARVDVIEPLGKELLVHVRIGEGEGTELRAAVSPETPVREGSTVGLRLRRDRLHLFDADSEERLG